MAFQANTGPLTGSFFQDLGKIPPQGKLDPTSPRPRRLSRLGPAPPTSSSEVYPLITVSTYYRMVTPTQASERTAAVAPTVLERINGLSRRVFRTRGGRLGSGMGLLLEALWGYYTTACLAEDSLEMAWLVDHQYNDFACLALDAEWDPLTRGGELFRVEAKSMNMGAEESKAHFDELAQNIRPDDLLVVIAWTWELDSGRNWPAVNEIFVAQALPIAQLRDALHLARGGTFVERATCPEGCSAENCSHHGEPLNSRGKRERLSGPESRRVSTRVSHAANFGGLIRMLKVRGNAARATLAAQTQENVIGRSYIEFIKRNFSH